jgi:hypothetical protein
MTIEALYEMKLSRDVIDNQVSESNPSYIKQFCESFYRGKYNKITIFNADDIIKKTEACSRFYFLPV